MHFALLLGCKMTNLDFIRSIEWRYGVQIFNPFKPIGLAYPYQ